MANLSPERYRRLAAWFEAALRLAPGSEREAYLAQVSAGDLGLRDDIERLLEADSEVRARPSSAQLHMPRFGAYQARRLLGAGGMGSVYLATREDGELRHRVAVKIASGVLWSPALDERFRRERQILAELQHPSIARFLDGGITGDGAPYLVMEYVEGERIDAWCQHEKLSIRARLKLFLKVCGAVSYAHQKLIVHRDLKPSNILVSQDGEPHLLDFGVARTLEPVTTDGQSTLTSGLFATPMYASPEVLRGEITGVGCDVYSLGVLLYELLSGRTPFEVTGLSPMAMVQQVLESDPPILSAAADSAAARRELRGDLDAIAAKALAKSPPERYASVEQMAEDIQRYLSGFPVQAGSIGAWRRARKFLGRNKGRASAAAVIVAVLLAGFIGTAWQARVARNERVASDRRFNQARELARYLVFDLAGSVGALPGSTPVRAEMVRRSLAYLDRLSAEKSNDENLRVELARGYLQLADVLGNPFRPNIGEPGPARESYRKAIAILTPIAAQSPDDRDARLSLARAQLNLGRSIGFGGATAEGRNLVQNAAAEFGRLAARWPSDFTVRSQAAIAYTADAQSLSIQGGYVAMENAAPALAAIRESIAQAQAALRLKPGDAVVLRQLSSSYKTLGDLTELHDRPGATQYFRQSLTALDALGASDRQTQENLRARSSALLGLGWNLGNLGQYRESLAALEEARQIRDRLSDEDPKNIQALYFRRIPLRDLAIVQQMAGHSAASFDAFLAAAAVDDRLIAQNPSTGDYRFSKAELESSAANLAMELGRAAEAKRLAARALPALKQIAERADASDVELAITARNLLETKVGPMRDPRAALQFVEKSAQMNAKDSEIQEILAEAYWFNRDRANAVQALRQSLSLIEKAPTPARRALEKTLQEYETAPLP